MGTREEKGRRENEQYRLSRGGDVREEMLRWRCDDCLHVCVCVCVCPFSALFVFYVVAVYGPKGCANAFGADATSIKYRN